ncbi:cytochrome b N-terminal domain-containing protein [Isosphaeraceae bacterium EP7]
MRKQLAAWMEDRTGVPSLLRRLVHTPIPVGSTRRHALKAALLALFGVQAVTGLLLMCDYSPSSTTAWGSVFYLNNQVQLGWFVRGLHRFGTTGMIALVLLALLQTVASGLYRAPREVGWWLLLALLPLTMGLGLTGNMLPWDQRGFWAATVETSIAGGVPLIGPQLRSLILGGHEPGNLSLTRVYALHVLVLPLLFVAVMVARTALAARRGHASTDPTEPYWPKQAFYDASCGAVALGLLTLGVIIAGGAPLDAPGDPTSTNYPARPEWYVFWLNRLLHKLPTGYEVLGTVVIPGALGAFLMALPFLDRLMPRRFAHAGSCILIFALTGQAAYLTFEAMRDDARNPEYSKAHQAAREAATRATQLAELAGIPPGGAGDLLRTDPLSAGLSLVRSRCLGCHAFQGETQVVDASPFKAFDLAHFGSHDWIGELLDDPKGPKFALRAPKSLGSKEFSNASLDGMKQWKEEIDFADRGERDAVVAFVATFPTIPPGTTAEEWASRPEVKEDPGYAPFVENCLSCHSIGTLDLGLPGSTRPAPDLFAYGSARWLTTIIKNPGTKGFYSYLKPHEQMPGFGEQLSPNELDLIVRLLRDEYVGAKPRAARTPREQAAE